MAVTKKQTALALATAAVIQIAAYGGYQWVNYPADKGIPITELERQLAQMEQKKAQEQLERWKNHPQEDGNPDWMIAKVLQGRSPADDTLTEREKTTIATWQGIADEERKVASGEVLRWGVDLAPSSGQSQQTTRQWQAEPKP